MLALCIFYFNFTYFSCVCVFEAFCYTVMVLKIICDISIIIIVVAVVVETRVFLHSLGCPGTHCKAVQPWSQRGPFTSASQVLEFKECTTISGGDFIIIIIIIIIVVVVVV